MTARAADPYALLVEKTLRRHVCQVCGSKTTACFGIGCSRNSEGRWFCPDHLPSDERTALEAAKTHNAREMQI